MLFSVNVWLTSPEKDVKKTCAPAFQVPVPVLARAMVHTCNAPVPSVGDPAKVSVIVGVAPLVVPAVIWAKPRLLVEAAAIEAMAQVPLPASHCVHHHSTYPAVSTILAGPADVDTYLSRLD